MNSGAAMKKGKAPEPLARKRSEILLGDVE